MAIVTQKRAVLGNNKKKVSWEQATEVPLVFRYDYTQKSQYYQSKSDYKMLNKLSPTLMFTNRDTEEENSISEQINKIED